MTEFAQNIVATLRIESLQTHPPD